LVLPMCHHYSILKALLIIQHINTVSTDTFYTCITTHGVNESFKRQHGAL
jgi:hypothetical protein